MDHFHHSSMQRLLYQDLGTPAVSPHISTHKQQSLRHRDLDRDRLHRSLLHHSCVSALLHVRSSLVLLDGMGLDLERAMALL